MRKYNFISGLPRSGSTLLSSIFNQNPNFTAGISDPLFEIIMNMIQIRTSLINAQGTLDTHKIEQLSLGLFDTYYKDDNPIVFNTHRMWTMHTALLKKLFPNFKMIVCVRDVPWIMDSFECLDSKNPFTLKSIYHYAQGTTVYDRYNILMGNVPDRAGNVKSPLDGLRQVVTSAEQSHICFVEYDKLASDPENMMKKIYSFIEEPYYNHDFNNVGVDYPEYDAPTGMNGLHLVRDKVSHVRRDTVLPADLWADAERMSFWKFDPQLKNKLNWL